MSSQCERGPQKKREKNNERQSEVPQGEGDYFFPNSVGTKKKKKKDEMTDGISALTWEGQ